MFLEASGIECEVAVSMIDVHCGWVSHKSWRIVLHQDTKVAAKFLTEAAHPRNSNIFQNVNDRLDLGPLQTAMTYHNQQNASSSILNFFSSVGALCPKYLKG